MPLRTTAALAIAALALLLMHPLPGGAATSLERAEDIIGRTAIHVTRYEDTLPRLARRHGVGFVELMAANPGVDPWLPGAGREVLVPTAHILPDAPRRGIVINLAELRLYFFGADGGIDTYPVGIGRDYRETPLLETTVIRKRRDPAWTPPQSIRAGRPGLPARVEPGPDNPLGAFALDLRHDAYVIHGTNRPSGVGRRVSHGCIRLYPEHVERLFARVATGTPVKIIDEPVKLGWSDGALWLEAHPGQDHADAVEAGRTPDYRVDIPGLMVRIVAIPGAADLDLDWPAMERALRERRGVPVRVSHPPRSGSTAPTADYLRSDAR
jgi:L,D-transpeptidase ErfK/SrfK